MIRQQRTGIMLAIYCPISSRPYRGVAPHGNNRYHNAICLVSRPVFQKLLLLVLSWLQSLCVSLKSRLIIALLAILHRPLLCHRTSNYLTVRLFLHYLISCSFSHPLDFVGIDSFWSRILRYVIFCTKANNAYQVILYGIYIASIIIKIKPTICGLYSYFYSLKARLLLRPRWLLRCQLEQ